MCIPNSLSFAALFSPMPSTFVRGISSVSVSTVFSVSGLICVVDVVSSLLSLLFCVVIVVVGSGSCGGKVGSSGRVFVSSVGSSVSVCGFSICIVSAIDEFLIVSSSLGVCCVIDSSVLSVDSSGVIGGSVLIGFFALGL